MNITLKIIFFLGFLLTLPIIILSMILVWCEDGLPMIFVQKRLGQNLKVFNLYKIRTMHKNAPNLGSHQVQKIHHLKFGSLIRKIKIDELPQLINYIRGDISIIGPRPGLPNQKELKFYRDKYKIFNSKPGITGLAQVLGYDMSNPELLASIDNLYLAEKTNKLDITIFFATFFSFPKKKLYKDYGNKINQLKNELNNV